MKISPRFASRKFSRGAYWICDPTYALEEAPPLGVSQINGHSLFVWQTACGDGLYNIFGPKCGTAGVDSAMLSIIPNDLIRSLEVEDRMKKFESSGLACSIRTARNFEVIEEEGDVFFLNYCVDTSGFIDAEACPATMLNQMLKNNP